MNDLNTLVQSAQTAFDAAQTPAELEDAKAIYLGKSGQLTELMKGLAKLTVEEKKTKGAAINVAKQAVEAALTARRQALADAQLQVQLLAQALDVTLPGRQRGTQGVGVHSQSGHLDGVLGGGVHQRGAIGPGHEVRRFAHEMAVVFDGVVPIT